MPNRWAVTHYLFTYQTGFLKRAFWGDLLWRIFGGWTANYFCLASVGLAVFFGFTWLVWRACRRLPATADTVPFLLVFAASPALAFSAHMAGYLEQVGYLALMLCLLARARWRWRVASLAATAALLPLVHEASFLWVGGLSGLAIVTAQAPARDRLRALAIVSAVWIVSTGIVLRYGGVDRLRLEEIRADRTAFFEFRPRQDAFQTLRVPLRRSLEDMQVRWADADTRADMAYSVIVFGPAFVFLGALAVRRARAVDGDAALRALTLALTAAALAGPLALHAVAWDRHRWNGLAALNAGLAALLLIQGGAVRENGGSRRGLALPLVLAIWSITAHPVFFDLYGPAHPPFTAQIQFLLEAVRHPDRNLWIPTQ